MPCLIAVYKDKDKTVISATNPLEIAAKSNSKQIEEIAKLILEKIKRAVNSLDKK